MAPVEIKLTKIDALIARAILNGPRTEDRDAMLTRLAYLSAYEEFCECTIEERVTGAAECNQDDGCTGTLILATDINFVSYANHVEIEEGDENCVTVVLEPVEE